MDGLKYSWQQAVLDAFGASPEALPIKINIAQKAIAARQKETPQPDGFERVAIREALQSLGELIDETRSESPRGIHFHIRWVSGKLDWERFSTTLEAEASAQQLVRPGETYTLQEFGDDCPRCAASIRKKADTA